VKTVMQLYAMLKPPSMIGNGRSPNRIRMELPVGGAAGRGNMPAGTAPVSPPLAAARGDIKTDGD